MPSTFGHALGGVATAWAADLLPGERRWRTVAPTATWYERAGGRLTLACAVVGALADADLLSSFHRTYSHSISAAVIVGLFAAAIAANANRPTVRIGLTCAAAYATHLLMDWMATDRVVPAGIQALWPFTRTWYLSGWDVFRQTERADFLSLPSVVVNLQAVAQEAAILVPVLVVFWLLRKKTLTRLAAQTSARDEADEAAPA